MNEFGIFERATNPITSTPPSILFILAGSVLLAVLVGMFLNTHLKRKRSMRLKRRRLRSA